MEKDEKGLKLEKVRYLSNFKIGDYIKVTDLNDPNNFNIYYIYKIDYSVQTQFTGYWEQHAYILLYVRSFISNGFFSAEPRSIYLDMEGYTMEKIDPAEYGLKVNRICPINNAICKYFKKIKVGDQEFDKFSCRSVNNKCPESYLPDDLTSIIYTPTDLTLEQLLQDEIEDAKAKSKKYDEEDKLRKQKYKENKELANRIKDEIFDSLELNNKLLKFNDNIKKFRVYTFNYYKDFDYNQLYQLYSVECYDHDANGKYIRLIFMKVNIDLTLSSTGFAYPFIELYVNNYKLKLDELKEFITTYPIDKKYLKGNYCFIMNKSCIYCKKHSCIKDFKSKDKCDQV